MQLLKTLVFVTGKFYQIGQMFASKAAASCHAKLTEGEGSVHFISSLMWLVL
jgi:hypothetical protein